MLTPEATRNAIAAQQRALESIGADMQTVAEALLSDIATLRAERDAARGERDGYLQHSKLVEVERDEIATTAAALKAYHEHTGDCPECDKIVCEEADDLWFAVNGSVSMRRGQATTTAAQRRALEDARRLLGRLEHAVGNWRKEYGLDEHAAVLTDITNTRQATERALADPATGGREGEMEQAP